MQSDTSHKYCNTYLVHQAWSFQSPDPKIWIALYIREFFVHIPYNKGMHFLHQCRLCHTSIMKECIRYRGQLGVLYKIALFLFQRLHRISVQQASEHIRSHSLKMSVITQCSRCRLWIIQIIVSKIMNEFCPCLATIKR